MNQNPIRFVITIATKHRETYRYTASFFHAAEALNDALAKLGDRKSGTFSITVQSLR